MRPGHGIYEKKSVPVRNGLFLTARIVTDERTATDSAVRNRRSQAATRQYRTRITTKKTMHIATVTLLRS